MAPHRWPPSLRWSVRGLRGLVKKAVRPRRAAVCVMRAIFLCACSSHWPRLFRRAMRRWRGESNLLKMHRPFPIISILLLVTHLMASLDWLDQSTRRDRLRLASRWSFHARAVSMSSQTWCTWCVLSASGEKEGLTPALAGQPLIGSTFAPAGHKPPSRGLGGHSVLLVFGDYLLVTHVLLVLPSPALPARR